MMDLSASLLIGASSSYNDSLANSEVLPPPSVSATEIVRTFVLGVTFAILIIAALFGNLLVCIAILFDRKLRQPENLFLASLAWADMLVAVLVMVFASVNDVLGRWIFGYYYCKIWMSFDIMCSTASILSLCAVSFDRWLHIRSPMKYEETMTPSKILTLIAGIWLLSASISFIPISIGLHINTEASGQASEQDTLLAYESCTLKLSPVYACLSSAISFYIPCAVMIVIYLRLYAYAQKHVRVIKEQRKTVLCAINTMNNSLHADIASLPSQNGTPVSAQKRSRFNRSESVTEYKARVTIGVIMGVFLFCWFPFFTINIVQAFCQCIPPWLFSLLTWIGYANSSVNPVIYTIFNQHFRKAFKRVLKCSSKSSYQSKLFKETQPLNRPKNEKQQTIIHEIKSNGEVCRVSLASSSSHSSDPV